MSDDESATAAESITLQVETEGVDEATEALNDLADAAERVNEAFDDLSVRVSAGQEFGRGVVDELKSLGGGGV